MPEVSISCDPGVRRASRGRVSYSRARHAEDFRLLIHFQYGLRHSRLSAVTLANSFILKRTYNKSHPRRERVGLWFSQPVSRLEGLVLGIGHRHCSIAWLHSARRGGAMVYIGSHSSFGLPDGLDNRVPFSRRTRTFLITETSSDYLQVFERSE